MSATKLTDTQLVTLVRGLADKISDASSLMTNNSVSFLGSRHSQDIKHDFFPFANTILQMKNTGCGKKHCGARFRR